jgi:hypothetical protein
MFTMHNVARDPLQEKDLSSSDQPTLLRMYSELLEREKKLALPPQEWLSQARLQSILSSPHGGYW